MPSTWTVLAAALFLWLGGMEAVCAQTINVLGNENKSVPTDYSAGPYSGGSIAKGGTLTVNAGNTLTLNSGFTLNNSGTLNINGALNNAGEIKGTVQGLQPSAVIRNDSGGKIIASSAHGIDLKAGGLVSNIGSGSVIQTSGGFGKAAVYIDGAAGTVNNLSGASINSTSYLGNGVFLGLGGAVLNDGIGSSISAKGGGVGIQGSVGRVDNTGGARITSDGVFGVQLEAGGTVLNHGQGSTISAAGTFSSTGVNFLNSSGSLVNTEGAVINTLGKGRLGVNLSQGGSVFNGEGSSIYGTFASVQSSGNTTLTNAGNLIGDVDLNATSKNDVHLWSGSQIKGDLKIGSNAASTLTLEGSNQQLYSDAVSGVTTFAGVLRMAGTGRWVLDQALNSVNTIIDSGTLVVAHNNALGLGAVNVGGTGTLQVNSGFTLENELNLSAGGTLSGTGTVGRVGNPATTVQSGAVIRGGDSDTTYGTLTVAGDLDMRAGAILQVRVDPSSNQASLVNVVGTATLTGSSVQHVGNVVNAASDFQTGVTYTILTANQITGRLQSAASNYAYLNATLGYLDGAQQEVTNPALNATKVTLTLQRKAGVRFADLAGTANQVAAANAIENLPNTHPVHQHVETLPVGAPAAALNGLSGDPHANWQSGLHAPSARAARLGPQRMHNNLTAGYRPGAAIAQSDGPLPASAWPTSKALPAWAEVVGHRQSVDGDGNAAKLTQNVYGLFIGADEEVGSNGWRVGGSLGYTNADAEVKSRDASADISSYSASVYTGKGFSHGMNRVNVMGGLAYTHHRIDSQRSVAGLGQNLKAKYSANTLQLFGEVGYAMGQYAKQGVEPFAGINISQQRVGSFQESGGFAALRGQSSTDTTTSTTLGVRAHSDIKLAGKATRLKGTVGWRHAWGDVTQSTTMAFAGSSSFTVAGTPLARNTALLGLQAEVELSRRAALELGYQGEYGSGMRDHAVNVKMRWAY